MSRHAATARRHNPRGPAVAAAHSAADGWAGTRDDAQMLRRLGFAVTGTPEQPQCVLSDGQNTVDAWGDPCQDCIEVAGPYLRASATAARLTRDDIVARDSDVHHAYALQRQLRSPAAPPSATASPPRRAARR